MLTGYNELFFEGMKADPNMAFGPDAMQTEKPSTTKEESADHWSWVIGLLESAKPLTEYLYRTAYEHGVKHGKEQNG